MPRTGVDLPHLGVFRGQVHEVEDFARHHAEGLSVRMERRAYIRARQWYNWSMRRESQDIHTYVCRAPTGASLMVDLRPANGETPDRDYARRLLTDHQTSAYVEVWTEDRLVEVVRRQD